MRISVEKVIFFLSATLLTLALGYAVRFFGWFPDRFIDRSARQAHRLVTDPPPPFAADRVYERFGARTVIPDRVQSGMTLIVSRWRDTNWSPEVRLIDRRGTAVHRWVISPGELFPETANRRIGWGSVRNRGLHGVRLLPGGDILINVNYVGTVRMDACGRVRWTLEAGSHHAVSPANDGSFWIPGVTKASQPVSKRFPKGYPGIDRSVYHDLLLHVGADGTVRDTVRVFDLLYGNGLERHLAKSGTSDGPDRTHLNDVEALPDSLADEFPGFESGDLLVSLRYLDLVAVVDPQAGTVKWHASHDFIQQHDPDFLKDGWIGVFDNNRDGTARGTMLGGSRVIAFQPHTDSSRVLFPTERSTPIFTTIMGNWQRLANGNLLLTESRAGRVAEVAPDGRTVWEWINAPYSENRVPHVSESHRYDLTAVDIASWPCSGQSHGNPSAQ